MSDCLFACLSVCLSVRLRISGTTRPHFTEFLSDVTCGCGSFLLWRRWDMLYGAGSP